MKNNALILASALALLIASCSTENNKEMAEKNPFAYPPTDTIDQTDDYFGVEIKDPYRWLEDDRSQPTADWVDAQNAFTFGYLDKISFRKDLKVRLTELWNYPKTSEPFKEGDFWYRYKNNGLQNQSVLYRSAYLNDENPQIFLDPNTLKKDGTAALGGVNFSKNGDYMAYAISEAGSDWQTIFVRNTKTGKDLSDKLEWCKFTGMAWHKDGFFYSRYDIPKGSALSQQNEYHKVYFHKLGEPQENDSLIFEQADFPKRYVHATTSDDENYLFISVSEGTSGEMLFFKDLTKPNAEFIQLNDNFKHDHHFVANIGTDLYFFTNYSAEKNKIVKASADNPTHQNWVDFIPENKTKVLEWAKYSGGKWFANYMKDAYNEVVQFSETGKKEKNIDLPTIGSVSGFDGKDDDAFVFYSFTSFTMPSTIYKYTIKTGVSEQFSSPQVDFNAEDFETKQVFYTSKDGTKVPMFLVHKKGLQLDGTNPTYLYAYGGFNISLNPSFDVKILPWLENGGVFAMPNLRGGGEYGEEWHKGGMLLNKQNVFDDFIAAAEYLIDQKYTSTEKLCISGRSNGGLLVGAVITQRPDLFGVALPGVGVLDMLRYHKFTIGWGWAVEYGSSDDSVHFQNLLKYSPLHNIKKTRYPATLVYTGDHDDRVVPAHSFKFISTLQANQVGSKPVMIRIDKDAGHGAGKPTAKQIDEWADIWSFVLYNMGEEF